MNTDKFSLRLVLPFALFLLPFALISCASLPPPSEALGPGAVRPFAKAVRQWRETGETKTRWVTVAQVDAVLETWDLRRSRAWQQARDLHWTDAELTAAVAREQADYNAAITIVCAVYTNHRKWNNWDLPGEDWALTLAGEGGVTARPLSVKTVTLSEADRFAFYPWIEPWHTVYKVRFPWRDAGGQAVWAGAPRLTFTASGPLGQVSVAWDAPPAR